MKLRSWLPALIIAAIVAGILLYWHAWLKAEDAKAADLAKVGRSPHPAPLPGARHMETAHYRITTTADDARTRQVGAAVEALHAAYADFFTGLPKRPGTGKLQLVLYAHQSEFKANNRSSPWAEAYYLSPVCYAYYADGETNPYHWMTHEATHQLNREVAGLHNAKWIEEGLATYFGTSRIVDGRLDPGNIDPDTYPIWWLYRSGLSGDLDKDLRESRWIPIRALITGVDAPSIHTNVNRYYIQYWSLSHFLFHHDHGRYAKGYRQLIAEGGTLENFERLIGPADRIEREWYDHLQARIADMER